MGEPTCLMRSFSHPSSASREAKEGDPLRALTESISFGRFMSETLAWEKWSTFSHNRYLEEVEQFSKPGTVAQKKAYFEANYKKRAAMKAAALPEQANATVNCIPEMEASCNDVNEIETAEKTLNDSSRDSLLAEATCDKQQEKQVLELACSSDTNVYDEMDGEENNLQNTMMERAEEVIQEKVQVENPIQVIYSKQVDNAENCSKIEATMDQKMPNKEAAEMVLPANDAALPSNERQMNSSSKSSSQIRASKIPKPSIKTSSSMQLKGGKDFKPNGKEISVKNLINEKRITAKSVHMSINLARCSVEKGKSSIRMSKECSTTPQNPARASIYGISKLLPSVNRRSEDRRTQSVLNKSVSGGAIAGSILQALSGNRTKSSTPNVSKTRSSIISSPFSIRSEERAAKRKEKPEERNISKEMEKTHMQVKSKIPLTRPRSPKLGRKPAPNVVRETGETGSQLSQRPPINAESTKHILPKGNQSTVRSVTSLSKKKTRENASPNVQH